MTEEHSVLDPEDERLVKSHLSGCAACRRELQDFRRVTDLLSAAAPTVEPPARLEERIASKLKVRGMHRRNWRPVRYAAAAVFVMALITGNLFQWTGVIRHGQAGASRLTVAVLQGTSDAPEAYGTVVLDAVDLAGVLAVTGLSRLDPAHQYQLWLICGAERRSAGVFSVDAGGYGSLLLAVPAGFRDFDALGISIEPAGGSSAPTGNRVMGGTF
jgi:anti-sigma-K factor RskA